MHKDSEAGSSAKVLVGINAKGGTGKSTSCISIGHSLASKGFKVLIVDLDPQSSLSLALGFKRDSHYPSIAEVLLEGLPIRDAIKKTSIDRLHVICGSMSLSSFDIMFAASKGRENKLKDALRKIEGDYDLIILDCPPTLSLAVLNAINAAHGLIVPVTPQYLSLEGLITLSEALERIRAGMGCKAEIMGIVLTMVDKRSKAAKEIIKLIRSHYKELVFKTEIPMNTRLAEAPSHGQSIFSYDWSSTGAAAYASLANEIVERMQINDNVFPQLNVTKIKGVRV
jgi:chromosome partitioning protein